MKRHWAWTSFTFLSLAAALCVTPATAQAPAGGPGGGPAAAPAGGPGGPGGGGPRGGGPGPGAGRGSGAAPAAIGGPGRGPGPAMGPGAGRGPGPGARLDSRVRGGAVDARYARVRAGGAPPLTIGGRAYVNGARYAGGPAYYNGRRYAGGRYYYPGGYYSGGWYDDGWFPGSLLAAPFLLPWALLGGGDWAYNRTGYYYDPYYAQPYGVSVGYGGPVNAPAPPLGNYCSTPQKICLLRQPAEVGVGCSCRAPAGLPRFRGAVTPLTEAPPSPESGRRHFFANLIWRKVAGRPRAYGQRIRPLADRRATVYMLE